MNGEDVHGPHYPRLPASSRGLANTTKTTSSGDLLATCLPASSGDLQLATCLSASSGGLASTTTTTSSGGLLPSCQLSPSTSASAEAGASISGDMFRTIC